MIPDGILVLSVEGKVERKEEWCKILAKRFSCFITLWEALWLVPYHTFRSLFLSISEKGPCIAPTTTTTFCSTVSRQRDRRATIPMDLVFCWLVPTTQWSQNIYLSQKKKQLIKVVAEIFMFLHSFCSSLVSGCSIYLLLCWPKFRKVFETPPLATYLKPADFQQPRTFISSTVLYTEWPCLWIWTRASTRFAFELIEAPWKSILKAFLLNRSLQLVKPDDAFLGVVQKEF